MPSLILTTFAPFEQFAHAKSSEGALFIFSPSKHAPLFAFWIFYWKACRVYLVFESDRGSQLFEARRGSRITRTGCS